MTFSVQIEDKGFTEAVLKAVGLSFKDFQQDYARLGDALLAEIQGQFEAERDPYGNAWAPLKAITVTIKRNRGSRTPDKILQDTGRLRQSFKTEIMPTGLSLFTDRVFPDGVTAEIHQFGGPASTKGGVIVPRELLPFKEQLPIEWFGWVERFTEAGVTRIFQ